MIISKKVFIFFVPAVAVIFSLAVYLGVRTFWPEATSVAVASNGDRVIPFTIETFDGKTLKIERLTGKKPLVINFWGSWCPPCRLEAPDIESTYKDFKGKVNFVGVAVQDSEAGARKFVKDFKITYPNGIDTDDYIMRLYKIYTLPMTIIYDRSGKMHYRHVGMINNKFLADKLRELL